MANLSACGGYTRSYMHVLQDGDEKRKVKQHKGWVIIEEWRVLI